VKDSDLRGTVKKMGIEMAGGQDQLKGKIFRIGNMGSVGAPEILATLAATEHAFRKQGFRIEGNGLEAACEVLG
jgi:aspartate aminotransferase-like enzyme